MPKLTVPVFYSEGTRTIDRLIRQLDMDRRVSETNKRLAREAAATLIRIMVDAQAKVIPGNA